MRLARWGMRLVRWGTSLVTLALAISYWHRGNLANCGLDDPSERQTLDPIGSWVFAAALLLISGAVLTLKVSASGLSLYGLRLAAVEPPLKDAKSTGDQSHRQAR
jgi:hypothetical protein